MASEAQLAVVIKGDVTDAVRKLNEVEKEAGGLGKTLQNVGAIATGFLAGAAVSSGLNFLKSAAEDAAADAASMSRLQQAIENTGTAYASLGSQVDDQIKRGQRLAFSDDQTRDSLSILTAQTGDYGEATKRLALAQDLARGRNIDVVTASKLLGKVTDENVNVLARYGIAAKKGMSETELFGLVQQKFGGQAQSFADSTAGKMERLKDRMGELKETIGYAVLPVMTALADVALQAMGVLEKLANLVGPVLSQAFAAVKPVIDSVVTTIGALVKYLSFSAGEGDTMNDWLSRLPGFLQPVALAIAELVEWFKARLPEAIAFVQQKFAELVEWFKARLPEAIAFVQQKFGELKVYFDSDIKPALENIRIALAAAFQALLPVLEKVFPIIQNYVEFYITLIKTYVGIITNVFAIVIDLLQGDWAGAWKNFKDLINVVLTGITDLIIAAFEYYKSIFDLGWEALRVLTALAWEGIKALIGLAWDGIKEGVKLGLQALWDYMNETFLGLPGLVVELGQRLAEAGLEAGKRLANGIIDGIGNLASRVADKLSIAGVSLGDVANFGSGLFRAAGGPVSAGQPYIVGERGPELFVPGRSGAIVPNSALGGAGVTVLIQGPVYARDEAEARRAGGDIGWAISMRRRGLAV